MSGIRKRDDLPDQKLYRVVCRPAGDESAPWKLVANYNRTYQTVSAARGMRTRLQRDHDAGRGYLYTIAREKFEFAVQVAPVGEWEILSDG